MAKINRNTLVQAPNLLLDLTHVGKAKKAVYFFVVVLAYTFSGVLSLKLASINHSTSPFWPASGIGIAAILMLGFHYWPAVFLGAFLTNLTTGISLPGVIAIAAGNTIESLLCSLVFLKIYNRETFGFYKESFALLFGGVAGCFVGATIGITTLLLTGTIQHDVLIDSWITWFGGDLVGALVFLPFFLSLPQMRQNFSEMSLVKVSRIFVYALLIYTLSRVVFTQNLPEGLYWANCLILLFANFNIGAVCARILLVLNCLLAIHYNLAGYTLFEFGNENLNLLYFQLIMISFSITAQFIEATIRQHLPRIAFAVFASGLLIIVITVSFLTFEEKKLKSRELTHLVEQTTSSLKKNEETYSILLRSGAGMLSTHNKPDYKLWKQYVSPLSLTNHYDAVNGLGFIFAVKKADIPNFIHQQRANGLSDYQIKVLDKKYSDQFDTSYLITFLEPIEKNKNAVGLDIGSEPIRRAGAELAAKRGDVTASDAIQLVQDDLKRPSFLIFYPVWKNTLSQKNVNIQSPKRELLGWTYAPVISSQFFSAALQPVSDSLIVKIDANHSSIYNEKELTNPKIQRSRFFVNDTLELFGRSHEIMIYPNAAFFMKNTGFPLAIGVILTMLLILLTTLIANISLFNSRLVDLVDQKTKELDLERSKVAHKNKLASLGEMSAGIAHEINNPLAVIVGNIPLIKKYKNDGEKFESRLDSMMRAALRIEKIVKGLRKFARTTDNNPLKNESLANIVSEAMIITEAKSKRHAVPVKAFVPPDIQIYCDAVDIEQVLVNLINNGIDAVKDRNEKWVKVESFIDRGEVVLQIIDSGPEISREVEPKLFQPFFTTKTVGEGTGLGLSISKGILEEHKATLTLNRSFKNTCFEIRFSVLKNNTSEAKNAP